MIMYGCPISEDTTNQISAMPYKELDFMLRNNLVTTLWLEEPPSTGSAFWVTPVVYVYD